LDATRNRLAVVNFRMWWQKMTESFYDETGRVAWTPKGGDPRQILE
jgi:hypothetical protein